MKNFIMFLKTDIKIINSYFLFAIIDILFTYLGIRYVYQSLVTTKRYERKR